MIVERTIIYCFVCPIIIVCGIVGNVLTLIIFSKSTEKSTTQQHLQSLAMTDTLILIFRFAYMVCVWWQLFLPNQYNSWKVKSMSFMSLSHLHERISKCITVVIVCERVLAVILPFKVKIICTPMRVKIVCAVIYAIAISTSYPYVIEPFFFFSKAGANNMTYPMTQKEVTQLFAFRGKKGNNVFLMVFNNIILGFIPIPLVIIGNVVIIIGLRKSKSMKSISNEAEQRRRKQDGKVTKLLLVVSVIFLILCGPHDINSLCLLLERKLATNYRLLLLNEILTTLQMLNSAINFIIYCAMNSKYRQDYIDVLFCPRRRNVKENSSQTKRSDKVGTIEDDTRF